MNRAIEIDQQAILAAETWVKLAIQLLEHRKKHAQLKKDENKNGKSK